jgi:hypothetical protein
MTTNDQASRGAESARTDQIGKAFAVLGHGMRKCPIWACSRGKVLPNTQRWSACRVSRDVPSVQTTRRFLRTFPVASGENWGGTSMTGIASPVRSNGSIR